MRGRPALTAGTRFISVIFCLNFGRNISTFFLWSQFSIKQRSDYVRQPHACGPVAFGMQSIWFVSIFVQLCSSQQIGMTVGITQPSSTAFTGSHNGRSQCTRASQTRHHAMRKVTSENNFQIWQGNDYPTATCGRGDRPRVQGVRYCNNQKWQLTAAA